MAKRRVLAVYWQDAAQRGEWADADDTRRFIEDPQECLTLGAEIASDKEAVHLSTSVSKDHIGGIWKIPRGMIRKILVLGKVETPD